VEVNYTDQILRDVLIRGIADHDIQLDILGDSNQDMSLEDTFRLIDAKESEKWFAAWLLSSQGVESAKSQCKEEPTQKRIICSYCGKTGHGKYVPLLKRKLRAPHSIRSVNTVTVCTKQKIYAE